MRLLAWAPLLLIIPLVTGCLGKKSDAQIARYLSSDINAGGMEGFKRTVYPFTRINCSGCHGVSQVPMFAVANDQDAYRASIQLVNFVEIPASKLVVKVKDGHCGGACSTDGTNMVKLITDWKNSFSNGSALPGAAVPKGNVFTNSLPVPPPNPGGCSLPGDLAFSPDIAGQNRCWTKFRYPVKLMTPSRAAQINRAWFEVDFSYENYASDNGIASYVIRNPRIVSPDTPVYIFDVKVFVNGNYHSEYGDAYRKIDTVVDVARFGTGCTIPPAPTPFDPNSIGSSCVPSVQPLFSTAASASGILQERTDPANPDLISFSFEYLQTGIVGDCRDLTMFDNNVYRPIKIGAVACLNCHKSGGQITEAGQRFNMDPDDPANGATAQDRLVTVCRRFLQRSNFALPESSPIIVQPQKGLNGMPPQDNFNFFAPDWITWIQREASLYGK